MTELPDGYVTEFLGIRGIAALTRLESGYYHVRYGANRFAQWRIGTMPTDDDFFGDWNEDERRTIVAMAVEALRDSQ